MLFFQLLLFQLHCKVYGVDIFGHGLAILTVMLK